MNWDRPQIWSSIWSDVNAPVPPHIAMTEAARCLNCHDAPCTKACPAGVDVREFIARIRSGNLHGAARIIRSANVFAACCGYVCPTEILCRRGCVQSNLTIPIDIGALQRYAVETAGWQDQPHFPKCGDKRVAIVGAGPAGLAAAHELRLHGIQSTVFSSHNYLGGLLANAIPVHRLPSSVVMKELKWIGEAGFDTVLNHNITSIADLLRQFDAVLLSCGAGDTAKLRIEGENHRTVMDALRFLEYAIYRPNLVHGFSKIIVIGGGNTALDTAVTAKQLGAKQVTVLYRRDLAQLPAWPREIHEALFLKHITLIPLCQPIRITPTENISIKKIECVSTALGNPDSSGRPFPIPIEGSNFELEADLIISAIGQVPNQSFELDLMEAGGRFKVDKDGRTSMPNVFAAGDFVTGSKTVVEAVAAGKRTANVIALQLTESPKNV